MKLGFLIRYFINTPLLVIIYISCAQKLAWGYRCSLRHNVCRHATDALANEYNLMNLSVWEMFTYGAWPTNILFTGVFYLLIKTEPYLKNIYFKNHKKFYFVFFQTNIIYVFHGEILFFITKNIVVNWQNVLLSYKKLKKNMIQITQH